MSDNDEAAKLTEAEKAYEEMKRRHGEPVPEMPDELRRRGATKTDLQVDWTFRDGSRLAARRGGLYLK